MSGFELQIVVPSPRAAKLLADIRSVERESERYARRYDWGNRVAWWCGLGLVWSSAALGLIGRDLFFADYFNISASMVGLGAAAGAGIETFRRRSFWRQLADAYWGKSVECHLLRTRYEYRMDDMSETERVHALYDDFTDAEDRFGDLRDRIIQDREKGSDRAPSQARRGREIERKRSKTRTSAAERPR